MSHKIDQIAYIAHNDLDEARIKDVLRLTNSNWIEDYVDARGVVHGLPTTNTAKLLFNYDLGIEVEILRYTGGDNYAKDLTGRSVCHLGLHWDGEGREPTFPYQVIQDVVTISHTNPYVVERGRRYHYKIYNSYFDLGHFLKVIRRIEP